MNLMTKLTCKACKKDQEVDCATCLGGWTCSNCNAWNVFEPTDEGIDWGTCPDFEGPEAALPTGLGYIPVGCVMEDYIGDGTIVEGKGGIIDVKIDEEFYKAHPGVLISTCDGFRMSREQWYVNMNGTDGLKLAIIQKLNYKKHGGGVHF